MAFLRIANLCKSYNITHTRKQTVLNGIDLKLEAGEFVALLGESGCGKSTLINILGGLDMDYTGSIVFKGEFLRDYDERQLDNFRKQHIGMIFQNYNLIGTMTLAENVEIAMTLTAVDKKTRRKRAEDLLRMVGLARYASKYPHQLSGGQKQRVAIARALANNPTMILADEPTGALDAESADLVIRILKKIADSGKLVIVVTHSEKVASECSRIVRMENGVIAEDKVICGTHRFKGCGRTVPAKKVKTTELGALAVRNVGHDIKRSALISLGISIGIAAVVLILCLSSGLSDYVQNMYSEQSTSLQIIVYKSGNSDFNAAQIEEVEGTEGVASVVRSLTAEDCSFSYAATESSGTLGTLREYYDTFAPEILYGSLPDGDGQILVNETFAEIVTEGGIISCIGETLTVTRDTVSVDLTISGIYYDYTDDADESMNAYCSGSAVSELLGSPSGCNTLLVTVEDSTYITAVTEDIESYGFETPRDDYSQSAETMQEYIDYAAGILTAIGAPSLCVSAIMILIVMNISVVERTKEIGIMRSIGARKADIRKVFLIESIFLGLAGGVLGIIECLIISTIVNVICLMTLSSMIISYGVGYYFLGLALCVIIGAVAGILPSFKASELDPVEALHAE